jgi:hypothetical protein
LGSLCEAPLDPSAWAEVSQAASSRREEKAGTSQGAHTIEKKGEVEEGLAPMFSSGGPTSLAHFGWVATFSPNELFNCLIYLSPLRCADILRCLLIA